MELKLNNIASESKLTTAADSVVDGSVKQSAKVCCVYIVLDIVVKNAVNFTLNSYHGCCL